MPKSRVVNLDPIESALDHVQELLDQNDKSDYVLLSPRDWGYLAGLRWGLWMALGNPNLSTTVGNIETRMEEAARRETAS